MTIILELLDRVENILEEEKMLFPKCFNLLPNNAAFLHMKQGCWNSGLCGKELNPFLHSFDKTLDWVVKG